MNALVRAETPPPLRAALLKPDVRLAGEIDEARCAAFHEQLEQTLDGEGPVVVEISTPGGDADLGRRMAGTVRFYQRESRRELWALGKAQVYSAGVTVMAAFPVARRWLTRDTTLLIHGRAQSKTIQLEGPLEGSRRRLLEEVAALDAGLRFEAEAFAELVAGSDVDLAELQERASTRWYLAADEARTRGLVGGVV